MATGGQLRRWRKALLAVATATLFIGLTAPAPAQAQNDAAADQRVVGLEATYAIDPDRGLVDVSETITVRNVKGNTVGSTTITSYYWTGHTIWVPEDADDLSVKSNGDDLTFELERTVQGIDIWSVD